MRRIEAGEAIESRLTKAFPGTEGIEEVISEIGKKKELFEKGRRTAEISSERAAKALREGRLVPEETGTALYERAKGIKAIEKAKFEEKFGKLDPTLPAPSTPL